MIRAQHAVGSADGLGPAGTDVLSRHHGKSVAAVSTTGDSGRSNIPGDARSGTAYTPPVDIYVIWFVAALALLVLELASTTFFSMFLAAGAFAAGILAYVVPSSPIWVQAVVGIVVAMAGVILVRPAAARRLHRRGTGPFMPGVHGGFVGQRALPTDGIGDELHPGHVRLAGETWLAFSADRQPFAAGVPVIVTAVHGTTLEVRPVDGSPTAADVSAASEA